MRILLIGDANHQFIRMLNKWLRSTNNQIQIDIYNVNTSFNQGYQKYYNNVFHAYHNNVLTSIINKIPLIRRYYNYFVFRHNFTKLPGNYDAIHVHFVSSSIFYIKDLLKLKAKKIIISFWGSDFYRAKIKNRVKIKDVIQLADKVTFTNSKMLNDVLSFFQIKDNRKFKIVRFGLEPLEKLKNLKSTKTESKKKLGLPTDKIIVVIGYNSGHAQQHVEIIKSLSKYTELREKIFLVVPLTYGPKGKYIQQIKKVLKDTALPNKLFTEYMSDKEVAHLRNAGDIMVQLQTTDQFSGSMQEHIYAGSIVITGSWLPYNILKENGIYFNEVDRIDEVGAKIVNILNDFEQEKRKSSNNKETIYKLSSWESNIDSWYKLYST